MVCSGDYLSEDQKLIERNKPLEFRIYLIEKGFFIYAMIMVIYGMIGLIFLSVICLACTLKYQKSKRSSSFRVENSYGSKNKSNSVKEKSEGLLWNKIYFTRKIILINLSILSFFYIKNN